MTGNKCLLDTSIVINAFKNDVAVLAELDNIEEVFLPVTVVGELFFGAYKSANPIKHLTQVRSFLLNCHLLQNDLLTADMYAGIKTNLLRKGKPIPENDIWIAAIACQYSLPVYTADKHFGEIDEIVLYK